jgi:hypothetical protein
MVKKLVKTLPRKLSRTEGRRSREAGRTRKAWKWPGVPGNDLGTT